MRILQDEAHENRPLSCFLQIVDSTAFSRRLRHALRAREAVLYGHSSRNEVNNGGFHQYFINSSGSYYGYAEEGVIALRATHTLELLRLAKGILFPTISVPVDTEMRRRIIPIVEVGASTPEWANKLDELDRRFYADSENLTSRLKAFARQQGLVSARKRADI